MNLLEVMISVIIVSTVLTIGAYLSIDGMKVMEDNNTLRDLSYLAETIRNEAEQSTDITEVQTKIDTCIQEYDGVTYTIGDEGNGLFKVSFEKGRFQEEFFIYLK
ncbi:hypothetical protein QTG56_23425 (plasmid) [Rossellomorea sp. AcN35-11]|nr:hypothetical protein [Rossellomorea aquimaris]WJV32316.1 hypothetical protein QTG56_23425 [Rossellomorea sp. AcN35-11]